MKKNVVKRFIAGCLAVAMICTSSQIANAATLVDGAQQSENQITVTDGMLVASQEDLGLKDAEKAILQNVAIQGDSYTSTMPTDNNLVVIDTANAPENIVVTAEKSGEWIPVSATLVYTVKGENKESTIEDTDNTDKFVGVFKCEADSYSVNVTYRWSIDVSKEKQEAVINIPYYLAKGVENLDTLLGTKADLDLAAENVDKVKAAVDNMIATYPTLNVSAKMGYLDALVEDAQTNNEKFELSLMLDEYSKADSKVEYLLDAGKDMKACAEELYDNMKGLYNFLYPLDDMFGLNIATELSYMNTIVDALGSAADKEKSDWSMLEEEVIDTLVRDDLSDEEYEALDKIVIEAKAKCSLHEVDDLSDFTAIVGENVITGTTNMYDVTIQVNASIVDPAKVDDKNLLSLKSEVITLSLAGNSDKATVEATISEKLATLEGDTLKYWETSYAGCDITNANAYTRTETKLADDFVLSEALAYSVTYKPNTYRVEGTGVSEFLFEELPYGYRLTLPAAPNATEAYDYKVGNTEKYNQGYVYKVTEDVTFTSTKGRAKSELSVFEIGAIDYAEELGEQRVNFLNQEALNSESVWLRKPTADDDLVMYDGTNVYAKAYEEWLPESIVGSNVRFVENNDSNKGEYPYVAKGVSSNKVEVIYAVKIDVANEEVLDMLNTSDDLAVQVAGQQSAMDRLMGQLDNDNLSLLKRGTLITLRDEVKSQETIDAINILIYGKDGDEDTYDGMIMNDGSSYLQAYAKEYDVAGRNLIYLYKGDFYTRLKAQLDLAVSQLDIIVKDKDVQDFELKGEKVGDALDSVTKIIAEITEALSDEPNTKLINISDAAAFNALVSAAKDVNNNAGRKDYKEKDVNGLYYRSEGLVALKTGEISVSVVMTVNGKSTTVGTITGTLSTEGEYVLTEADANTLAAKYSEEMNKLNGAQYYNISGELPKAGAVYKTSSSHEIIVTPKTYTVIIKDETGKEVAAKTTSINSQFEITLDYDAPDGYEYEYVIGGNTVTSLTYTIDPELFIDGTYVITRKTLDTNYENLITFVKGLNAQLPESSKSAFILTMNDEGKYSIVYRNEVSEVKEMTSILMPVVQNLILNPTYSQIDMNGRTFVSGGTASVQVLIDAMIASGFGTNTILEVIDANGNIVENIKAGKVVAIDGLSIPTADILGGKLMKAEMTLGGSTNVDFYISLVDFGKDKADVLAKGRKAIDKADEYLAVNGVDGNLQCDATLPASVYELYLTAMLLQGETDLENVNNLDLKTVMDYALDFTRPVIDDTSVTTDTFENTAAEIGKNVDLSSYGTIIEKGLAGARYLLDESNLKVKEINSDDSSYTATLEYIPVREALDKAVQAAGMEDAASALAMIVEYNSNTALTIDVHVTLSNNEKEYAALILDNSKSGLAKHNYVTADEAIKAINEAGENAIIILLSDITGNIALKNAVIFNLNGHKVKGDLTSSAGATTLIADGVLATNSGAGVTGKVTGNFCITGGAYGELEDGMLPEGYTQEASTVVNRFYTITKDGEKLQIVIDPDFMELEGNVEWKKLAADMALDVAFNAYTSAAVAIDGNPIYKIEAKDLIALYKDGLKTSAVELVNDSINFNDGFAGVNAFVDKVIAALTDFDGMATALKASGNTSDAIAEFKVVSNPWKIEVDVNNKSDYITGNIDANDEINNSAVVELVVGGTQDERAELQELCRELSTVVTEVDVNADLTELEYVLGEGLNVNMENNTAKVKVDFTKSDKPYVAVIGVIMANGMTGDAKTAMVDAVNEYLEDGITVNLVAAIENLTAKQIIKSLKAANGVAFEDMVKDLGINDADGNAAALEAVYADAFEICYLIINRLDVTGGDRKVASFAIEGTFGTYGYTNENWKGVDLALEVVLAEEVTEAVDKTPVIKTPVVTNKGAIRGSYVDEDAKLIYLDVDADGLLHKDFEKYVNFEVENGEITGYKFSDSAISLVQTAEEVTVEAKNGDVTNKVKYKVIILGDVKLLNNNLGDGKIQSNDATVILKYLVDKLSLSATAKLAAGINQTKGVDAGDATIVLKKVVDKSYKTWL